MAPSIKINTRENKDCPGQNSKGRCKTVGKGEGMKAFIMAEKLINLDNDELHPIKGKRSYKWAINI